MSEKKSSMSRRAMLQNVGKAAVASVLLPRALEAVILPEISLSEPAPGAAPSPGPMKVADDKLRSLLGVTDVTFKRGQQRLAIIDKPLQD